MRLGRRPRSARAWPASASAGGRPHWIAAFVRDSGGAVYSSEILDRFFLSDSTLRRRRPELARLGIRFLENGRGSVYATAELVQHLPDNSLPK